MAEEAVQLVARVQRETERRMRMEEQLQRSRRNGAMLQTSKRDYVVEIRVKLEAETAPRQPVTDERMRCIRS